MGLVLAFGVGPVDEAQKEVAKCQGWRNRECPGLPLAGGDLSNSEQKVVHGRVGRTFT